MQETVDDIMFYCEQEVDLKRFKIEFELKDQDKRENSCGTLFKR
jgi:hypothetical protein